MTLLSIILFICIFIWILYVYYIFYSLAVAIWIPKRASQKWLALLGRPEFQIGYFFFKWIGPLFLILGTTYTILLVTVNALKYLGFG